MPTDDLHYDDKTLDKVRDALHCILGGNIRDQRLTDCISEMQNRGILFRERRPAETGPAS
jgi:hypothetical protein